MRTTSRNSRPKSACYLDQRGPRLQPLKEAARVADWGYRLQAAARLQPLEETAAQAARRRGARRDGGRQLAAIAHEQQLHEIGGD